MNYAEICIIKRDGKREDFSISKIKNAIGKAFHASGIDNEDKLIAEITMRVISNFVSPTISVEEIQDLVEKELMKVRPEVAKKYIIYREWRNTERDRKTQMKHIMDGIVAIDKNDVNLSNANMSSHTPAGQMMTFASEVTKDYTYKYLLPKKYAEAHQLGDIHIHDLDYYPTKTTTCIQYDLDDLFERGFRTKNGSIRTPQSIQSYATLATIIFQTNQNEQHGGQAIPAFDFFMAEGVRKTFRKHLKTLTEFYIEVEGKEPGTEALKKIEEKAGLCIYNLGTGHGYSVLDIVKNFEAANDIQIPYSIKPRRAGDIATCYCDPSKAERELGWKAQYGIREMCEDSWRWQKNNPNGCEGEE